MIQAGTIRLCLVMKQPGLPTADGLPRSVEWSLSWILHTTLWADSRNPSQGIHPSKGVGVPPFGLTVTFSANFLEKLRPLCVYLLRSVRTQELFTLWRATSGPQQPASIFTIFTQHSAITVALKQCCLFFISGRPEHIFLSCKKVGSSVFIFTFEIGDG